ncbi:MAG: hypothetical protein M1834_006462 [Cirrosporium novae-zelandiae]|nr:MAG: hypothetical protein M1834_006462 [Cirrosporium novae-zelandiae]
MSGIVDTAQGPQPPYPLHESVKDRLDPEYVSFYNKHIINNQQVHYQPVAASRTSGILIPGGGPLVPVGNTEDFSIKRIETEGPDVKVRVFTPTGEKPENGWPVMVYYHGGGWVLGTIDTENTVCTNMCARANCVVVNADYRLAPEYPFPACVEDSWEALLWIVTLAVPLLSLDISRMAIGGSSAGGNLAAIMTHKALARPNDIPPFKKQLLVVPVMDNTATVETNWAYKEFENTAALPSIKMIWYRKHYLPNDADWNHPEASPIFYDDDWSKLPPAVVTVGELDVLRAEGEAYAEKLQKAGVKAELHVMKGMPHPFLAMDGILEAGKQAITYLCEGLEESL